MLLNPNVERQAIFVRVKKPLILFFCFVFITPFCFSQNDATKLYKHSVGFGAFYFDDDAYVFGVTYGLLKKRENELIFSFNYIYSNSNISEIAFGGGYSYSVFKKESLFDLMLKYGVNIYYDRRDVYGISEKFWRWGPYVWAGFSPMVNFSKRVSLVVDLNLGYGYLWSKEYNYTFNSRNYTHSEEGAYFFAIPLVKVNYKF